MFRRMKSALCLMLALALTAGGCFAEAAPSLKDAALTHSTVSAAPKEPPSLADDFYEVVNADWLATAEIPSDQPETGGFLDLSDVIEEQLMADFDAMCSGEKQPDSAELASFVEFYRLAMDFEARDAAGADPLKPYMERVEALESLSALNAQLVEWDLDDMPLPFVASVVADMGNAAQNALYMAAPGLFLMDQAYYQDENLKAMLQIAYGQMSINLLVLAGKTEEEAEQIVSGALAFDERLSAYARSAEEASDYTKMYNPVDFAELDEAIDCFDLTAAFEELLGATPETVVLIDPTYFDALDELVNEETFPEMKDWMLVQTVKAFAPFLSDDFRVEAGRFSRMFSGVVEPESREESAYYLASSMFSEVVGVYYGKTYFGEQARQDVTDMVGRLIEVYEQRLKANEWLSDETREMAIRKLETMTINVGYPDEPRALYSQMQTVPASEGGTLVGNAMAFTHLIKADNYAQWSQPVNRGLWSLSADTVNAAYAPMDNSINFPAAILQAPFYSTEQSDAANYGGIGAVIAHEISHAFDPNGSKFDEMGSLADWWTEADYAKFEALSQAMVDEFDGLRCAGGTVNGAQTKAENVADAGGLACALEALKQEEDANLAEFFTNWAVIWRQKATPEYESLLLTLDVHSPNKLRANIQLQNMDDFYTTFDIQEGDGMYRAPEERVTIW
ncbi:MAG: M13 family metallopeptidase [Clostridia bacterium]|nr:M13 family metallopeptidase [Clostridia bacterium]